MKTEHPAATKRTTMWCILQKEGEMDSKELAILFHNTYERLAPEFGYRTRIETREFDEHSSNGRLMIAVCNEILQSLKLE